MRRGVKETGVASLAKVVFPRQDFGQCVWMEKHQKIVGALFFGKFRDARFTRQAFFHLEQGGGNQARIYKVFFRRGFTSLPMTLHRAIGPG
jgi:hypothetical protein